MSKIGLKPIILGKANVEILSDLLKISGAKGSFEYILPKGLFAKIDSGKLFISIDKTLSSSDFYEANILWGSSRSLIQNKVIGVTEGFQVVLVITGLGFKAVLDANKKMTFSLGYSHKLELAVPEGILVEVDKTGQRITLKGIDKNTIGDFASKIKALRKVEPYKGTGIIIEGEKVLRKAGKSTK